MFTTNDLIVNAVDKKPNEFNHVFSELLTKKLEVMVQEKKDEMKKTIFNTK